MFPFNKSLPSGEIHSSLGLFSVPFVVLVNALCRYFPGNEARATPIIEGDRNLPGKVAQAFIFVWKCKCRFGYVNFVTCLSNLFSSFSIISSQGLFQLEVNGVSPL